MDFTEYKCPVCNEQFQAGEDIVVCPECGAPHHRGCYESLEHCYYEDKHSDSFSFENISNNNNEENSGDNSSAHTVVCPRCKTENPREIFYCQNCGLPLTDNDKNSGNNQQIPNYQGQYNQGNVPPINYGTGFVFDPMAGLDSNQPIADNVTAGEMAKFVGKNTQYYLRVFNRIKNFNASKYNFAAFLFSGIYFLYRKMIGLGILFSILIIGLTIGELFVQITPEYQSLLTSILNSQSDTQALYTYSLSGFSTSEKMFFYLPFLFSGIKFIIMIVCGAIANRKYYKHCTKKITSVKSAVSENINKKLESSGGVNFAFAICVAVIYIGITYIPLFM